MSFIFIVKSKSAVVRIQSSLSNLSHLIDVTVDGLKIDLPFELIPLFSFRDVFFCRKSNWLISINVRYKFQHLSLPLQCFRKNSILELQLLPSCSQTFFAWIQPLSWEQDGLHSLNSKLNACSVFYFHAKIFCGESGYRSRCLSNANRKLPFELIPLS